MKIFEIVEARKNPEQNPKTSINSTIIAAVDNAKNKIAGVKNVFVSFTKVDKLGINPTSKYKTPLGIYAYPGEYVVRTTGDYDAMYKLPFAGDSPFVNIFNAQGNIINVATITPEETRVYYKRIAELWAKISGKTWKTSVDEIEEIVNDAAKKAKFSDLPGGQLWYVTKTAATQYFAPFWKTTDPVAWNKLFRSIGIDGVVDYEYGTGGVGIIHTSEPTQAVFFTKQNVVNIQRYYNKYSPSDVSHRKLGGDTMSNLISDFAKKIKAESDPEKIFNFLANNNFRFFKLVKDQKVRNYILNKDPSTIRNLPHANEQDQRAALTADIETALYYIKKPSEAVTLDVLKSNPEIKINPFAISRAFPHAGEELQMIAVKLIPGVLSDFETSYPSTVQYVVDVYEKQHSPQPAWLIHRAKKHNIPVNRRFSPEVLEANKEIDYLKGKEKELIDEIDKLEQMWEKEKLSVPAEHHELYKQVIDAKIIELDIALSNVRNRMAKIQKFLEKQLN